MEKHLGGREGDGGGGRAARQGAEALGWQEDTVIGCECLTTVTPTCNPHEEVAVRSINVIYIY